MRIRSWLCIFCLCLVCLGGCGEGKAPGSSQGDQDPGSSAASGSDVTFIKEDWMTKGIPVQEGVEEETALWAGEYVPWQHGDIDYDPSDEFVYEKQAWIQGERIYRLCDVYTTEWDWERTLLETYDVTNGQASLTELDGERFGIDGGFVVGMYVTEPGKYVFRIQDGEGQVDRIVHSDLGDQNRAVDLMPACLEKGGAGQLGRECMCDGKGYVYSRDAYGQELYVLDGEGRLLLEYGGGDVFIDDPLRMPSGELLFPVNDRETGTFQLVWFNPEQKKVQTVSSFETTSEPSVCGIQGSDIYYKTGEGIVRWNVTSGARTMVYRFNQDQRLFRTMLVLRDGDVPVLRMYGSVDGQEEDWLVTLSEEEPELKDAIRVADLVRSPSSIYDVKNLVATVSRKYRNARFVYETYDNSGAEDYRTRILAELAAGGGPDVLFVSLQDMRLLQGQGYLTDLRSVLPEASRNRILPAVIRMGTAGDTFAGLAPAMSAYSAMTLKEFWDRDTWTLEDVLDLMDTGQFTGVMCQWTMPFAPQAVVKFLTEFGLWDASLVDWETGKCHFDGDLFVRLLQTAKTYQLNPFGQETGLGAGGCLMDLGGLGLDDFNRLYDRYGEGYRVIGFPSVGNYLNCEGVLVVNRKVSDEKAVSAFLEYLLSEKVQDSPYYSILKVSSEDLEYREVGGEKKAYWKKQEVRIKEDGTTTLEDYAAFLEGCNPPPALADSDLIQSIVWEEAEAFIVGDKSAEDVGKIIQRRIQVYLDENR